MTVMEMAISEIALVVFTTMAPAGAVGYVVMAFVALVVGRRSGEGAGGIGPGTQICRYLVVPLSLALVGLIASATHLGTPANALYVITGVGRSPLSNEVASAAVFLALGGACWMVAFPFGSNRVLRTALLAVSSAAALVFVLSVSAAYSVESIPTWSNPLAPLTLWGNAVASGALVGLCGVNFSGVVVGLRFTRAMAIFSAVVSVANTGVMFAERHVLEGIQTVAHTALGQVPFFVSSAVVFLLLSLSASFLVWFFCGRDRGARSGFGADRRICSTPLAAAVFLSLAACFAVRFAFYSMYMTSGV